MTICEAQGRRTPSVKSLAWSLVVRVLPIALPVSCVRPTAILGDGRTIVLFPEIIEDDDDFDVAADPFLSLNELAAEPDFKVTSDILINRSKFEKDGDEDQLNRIESGVRFDTCKDAEETTYRAYKTLLHESGHALGIFGHASTKLWYTAMKWKEDLLPCTPFPLDVMATYALYQTRQ